MVTEHIKIRRKVKKIATVEDFYKLLDTVILSDEEKELLKMHYIANRDFRYIGDRLGYAEITIKKKHQKALRKMGDIL